MPSFPNWTKNILFLLVYIFSGGALALIIDGVSTGTELTPFNTTIEAAIIHIRNPILTSFFFTITNVGNPWFLCVVSAIILILLLTRKEIYHAALYGVSMIIAIISIVVLKNTFNIARPDAALTGFSGWSFPSGHATVATAFFFALAYSFFNWPKTATGKLTLILGSILGGGLICFSRLYLGAHWSLDILAGVALGLLSVSFTALVFNIFLEERFLRRKKSYN